jgi:6-phospho-3-hexuloisomerase
MTTNVDRQSGFGNAAAVVLEENHRLLTSIPAKQWDHAGDVIMGARAIFVIGGGRSGLAVQMAAMRLMHLGLNVHVVGEVTAPAIGAGDLLIAVSGSGTTPAIVAAASTAKKVGASVVSVTTAAQSPLSQIADVRLVLPAADKQDRSASVSSQYAGSLFEQSVVLAFDALFQSLRSRGDKSVAELWKRHANIG